MYLGKEVEILDATSENFKEELEFAIWSIEQLKEKIDKNINFVLIKLD
jgi:hypothetical protein